MAAAASAGGEWEICNDNGFVYKRPRGLYSADRDGASAAVPSTPVPPPESVLLQRRRALLRLREKYLVELSRWEALSSDLLAPLPTPPGSSSPRPSRFPPLPSPPRLLPPHPTSPSSTTSSRRRRCRRRCSRSCRRCATRWTSCAARTRRPSWMPSLPCRYGATHGSLWTRCAVRLSTLSLVPIRHFSSVSAFCTYLDSLLCCDW